MPSTKTVVAWIRTQLQETTANRWTDVECLRSWDEAQKDFSIRTELLETQVSMATVAGTATYALTNFPRFLKARKVIYDFGTMTAIPMKYFDYQDYPWPQKSQQNIPYGYTIFDDKIELLFKPDAAKTLQVVYVYSCSTLDENIAVSAFGYGSDLPDRYHLKAAEKAVGDLLMKYDETVQRANVHFGLYEKFVKESLSLQRRPADDTRQAYFKTYASPGFNQQGEFGSGYTGRPLISP